MTFTQLFGGFADIFLFMFSYLVDDKAEPDLFQVFLVLKLVPAPRSSRYPRLAVIKVFPGCKTAAKAMISPGQNRQPSLMLMVVCSLSISSLMVYAQALLTYVTDSPSVST